MSDAIFYGRSRINERQGPMAMALVMGGVAGWLALFIVLHATAAWFWGPLGAIVVLGSIPTRIAVEADGVRVAWLLSRWVPYRQVDGVEALARADLALRLRDGRCVVLPITPRNRKHDRETKRSALYEALSVRLTEARLLEQKTAYR